MGRRKRFLLVPIKRPIADVKTAGSSSLAENQMITTSKLQDSAKSRSGKADSAPGGWEIAAADGKSLLAKRASRLSTSTPGVSNRANEQGQESEMVQPFDVSDRGLGGHKQKGTKKQIQGRKQQWKQSSLRTDTGNIMEGPFSGRLSNWGPRPIEHFTSDVQDDVKVHGENYRPDSSIIQTSLSMQEDRDKQEEAREVPNEGLSSITLAYYDFGTKRLIHVAINKAEPSVAEIHLITTQPTAHYYQLYAALSLRYPFSYIVTHLLSDTEENNYTAGGHHSSMPPLRAAEERSPRQRREAQPLYRVKFTSPQLPDWLAKSQVANSTPSAVYAGIQMPRPVHSTGLETHLQMINESISHDPAAASVSTGADWSKSPVGDNDRTPIPESEVNPDSHHEIYQRQSVGPESSGTRLSYSSVAEQRMALRDQSTNSPSLPASAQSHSQRGLLAPVKAGREQHVRIAPHLRVPEKSSIPGTSKAQTERTAPPGQSLANVPEVAVAQQPEWMSHPLRAPLEDSIAGAADLYFAQVNAEAAGNLESTEFGRQPDQTPPIPASSGFSRRLVTKPSDFMSQATIKLNNSRQTIPSHHPSPQSTDVIAEVSEEHKRAPPPLESDTSMAAPPSRSPLATIPQGPIPTSDAVEENNMQQDAERDDHTPANIAAETHAKPPSPAKSSRANESDVSVRGEADQDCLSSIEDSDFFKYAYNARDASITSEIVFQGRKPRNPYKRPQEAPTPVPGWENVERNEYQPGQLMGWDGNWQEAPVEWNRRDLYDYCAAEHQENVKEFVKERFEAFKNHLCPVLNVKDDKLFMEGHALAVGYPYFGKPINPSEHVHLPPDDPFSQGKLTKTATTSTENYLRVNAKRLDEQGNRERASADRKSAKAQRKAEQKIRQAALVEAAQNRPPNPFLPKINIYIRPAEPKDLYQIRRIHNYHIRTTTATGEPVELSDREWRSRLDDARTEKFPFLVAILAHHGKMERVEGKKEEKIVGFAYAEDFAGEQTIWGHTCEVQLHVDHYYWRQGVGKNLMDCLLRGLNPTYQSKNAVRFLFPAGENDRYEGGGERIFTNILFALPYAADEEARAQWMREWLVKWFDFELQGVLRGVGYGVRDRKRINLAYLIMETFAAI
ncbi:MAG: hypothetical protein Q9182_002281 [Xanthomendoza sp. 2 TL-2023]